MAVNLKQNADGSMGMQGTDLDDGGFLTVNIEYVAASVDKDRKSTRLNSSHSQQSRMPSSA